MSNSTISHALVLPDDNFHDWLAVVQNYRQKFERVAIIRDPAGNDLNPYRNVSAVVAPKMWVDDNPLTHIRRIYPQVVRVDVLNARNPQELETILAARVAANDRFGETLNAGEHLHDRFTLSWATDYRPMRITENFTKRPTGTASDNLGIKIACQVGSNVLAAAAGTVTREWAGDADDELGVGKYVQVTTQHGIDTYVITYAGLRNISIPMNRIVSIGDRLGESADKNFLLIVQQLNAGKSGYRLPDIIDPTHLIYIDNFRVRPIDDGLRIRSAPNTDTDDNILASIDSPQLLQSKESHGRTLGKVGVEGEWLRVRLPDGRLGFTAAWFLEATQFKRIKITGNPVGVNLDARHPLGKPEPHLLGKMGWVRFGYNVSNNVGSEDIQAAYDVYAPLAEKYVNAGYKVIMTTSHQTYGEGKNEFWPWRNMTDDSWTKLSQSFAEMMGKIAKQYAGKGLIHAWQIWNEQDAELGAEASVALSPENYARMINKVEPAIRSGDSQVLVLTGGHNSGPGAGSNYAKITLKNLSSGVTLDGLSFHPYGRGVKDMTYAPWGKIDVSIDKYSAVMPDKPLWITEWGVLERPNDSPTAIAKYAEEMITHLTEKHGDKVACLIWYAWAQGMHNGYGLVDEHKRIRTPLTELFTG